MSCPKLAEPQVGRIQRHLSKCVLYNLHIFSFPLFQGTSGVLQSTYSDTLLLRVPAKPTTGHTSDI